MTTSLAEQTAAEESTMSDLVPGQPEVAETVTASGSLAQIPDSGDTAQATAAVTQPPAAKASSGGFPVLPVLIVVLLLAIAAAVAVLLKRKKAGNADEPEDVSSTETGAEGASGIRVGGAQTIGKRQDQEDSFCYSNWQNRAEYTERGLLAAVSDGIGGLENSQVASQTAMKNMRARFLRQNPGIAPADRLLELAAGAQSDVQAVNSGRPAGSRPMGATLVSVLIQRDMLWMLSIGDSRVYLYRAGGLLPLNRPHTFGKENREDQVMRNAGAPSTPANDKKLTAYLGQENLRRVDRTVNPMRLLPGDRVLLMSDGVFNTIGEDEMARYMGLEPAQASEAIIRAVVAADAPHQDNATVVVIAID